MSLDLTERIAEELAPEGHQSKEALALHAIVGALVQHDTANGGNAFDPIDVERVFAAVKRLKDREADDLSAFVQAWIPAASPTNGDATLPSFWADDLRKALSSGHSTRIADIIAGGFRSLQRADESGVFRSLEYRMLRALTRVLNVDQDRVAYLTPMITATPLVGIATLNYDLTVETACAQRGTSCDTGLTAWAGGYNWAWSKDAQVRLLKLHGSVDYVLGTARGGGMRMSGDRLQHAVQTNDAPRIPGTPAMVFGKGTKLRSDGPFLAMLVELDRMLAETEWLTIVGYSFRDEHINAALSRWLNSGTAERVSIIDPSLHSAWSEHSPRTPSYVRELVLGVGGGSSSASEDLYAVRSGSWPVLEHDFIAQGARAGLEHLHG